MTLGNLSTEFYTTLMFNDTEGMYNVHQEYILKYITLKSTGAYHVTPTSYKW